MSFENKVITNDIVKKSSEKEEIFTLTINDEVIKAFMQQKIPQMGDVIYKNFNRKEQIVRNKNNLISFCQDTICDQVKKEPEHFKTLEGFILKFDGLCELISNYVIMENLLGKDTCEDTSHFNEKLSRGNFSYGWQDGALFLNPPVNHLKAQIGLFALNQKEVKQSHILYFSSMFEKLMAYLFNIYPHDLFSVFDKVQQSDNKVNEMLLSQKLNTLDDGAYIKFSVFTKGIFSFQGHSMVIKKTGHDYSFFDPNVGEHLHLNSAGLCSKINDAMKRYHGTHMAFINGSEYVAGLKKENESKENQAKGSNELLMR